MAREIKDNQDVNDYVGNIVKKAGTSFYWGMRFLPKNKRNAMFTVYAFCRVVDDIADGELSLDEKKQQLNVTVCPYVNDWSAVASVPLFAWKRIV